MGCSEVPYSDKMNKSFSTKYGVVLIGVLIVAFTAGYFVRDQRDRSWMEEGKADLESYVDRGEMVPTHHLFLWLVNDTGRNKETVTPELQDTMRELSEVSSSVSFPIHTLAFQQCEDEQWEMFATWAIYDISDFTERANVVWESTSNNHWLTSEGTEVQLVGEPHTSEHLSFLSPSVLVNTTSPCMFSDDEVKAVLQVPG